MTKSNKLHDINQLVVREVSFTESAFIKHREEMYASSPQALLRERGTNILHIKDNYREQDVGVLNKLIKKTRKKMLDIHKQYGISKNYKIDITDMTHDGFILLDIGESIKYDTVHDLLVKLVGVHKDFSLVVPMYFTSDLDNEEDIKIIMPNTIAQEYVNNYYANLVYTNIKNQYEEGVDICKYNPYRIEHLHATEKFNNLKGEVYTLELNVKTDIEGVVRELLGLIDTDEGQDVEAVKHNFTEYTTEVIGILNQEGHEKVIARLADMGLSQKLETLLKNSYTRGERGKTLQVDVQFKDKEGVFLKGLVYRLDDK